MDTRSKSTRPKVRLATTFVVLSLLLTSLPTLAEAPELRREWRQMKTPNFSIFGDASERQMKEVGDSLEGLHAFLSQMSNQGVEAPIPTLVYVFRDDRSFNPYGLLQPNGERLDSSGFFYRRQHANYIAVDGSNRDAMLGTTLHEYVHFFVSYRLRGIPVWLNEGLAEFYSTFQPGKDYVNIGKPISNHLWWLKRNTMIPLLDLFAVDHQSPEYNESDRRGVFYAQSWALVHYLFLEREQGRSQLIEFLKLRTTLPIEQAFQQAFQTTPDEMFRKLRKYVRSKRFTYRQGDFAIEDQREKFSFAELSDAEAFSRLGELLAIQGRGDEATAHAQAALSLDPNQAGAFLALGLIEVKPDGDANIAVDQLTAARRLAPDDRTVIFLQAQARSMRGDPGKALRQDLVKLVNANPQFLDAWRLLAWSWGGETENIEEATRIYEGAHSMMPDVESYAKSLLYYYDVSDRLDDAEALMDRFFRPRGLEPQRAFRNRQPLSSSAGGGEVVSSAGKQEQGNYDKIDRASRLINEQEYSEALGIYEELVASNPDARSLIAKRDELKKVVAHNRFIEGYNTAVDLFGKWEWRKAAEKLEALLAGHLSAEHRAKAEELHVQAKAEWKKRGESGL